MTPLRSNPLSPLQSGRNSDRKPSQAEQIRVGWSKTPGFYTFTGLCMLFCGWLVKDDVCNNEAKYEQPVPKEDILFFTLCNAELVVEWGIGAAVFIRCFVDRRGTLDQIYSRLGNGFSMAPFASMVLVCTLVAFLASVPLGELFFFHLILMRKGISTYAYVVAMRAQAEAQMDSPGPVEEESELSSPGASTATGLSGGSSFGIQMRGGSSWCTPPRIFIEHQDEYIDMASPGVWTLMSEAVSVAMASLLRFLIP